MLIEIERYTEAYDLRSSEVSSLDTILDKLTKIVIRKKVQMVD